MKTLSFGKMKESKIPKSDKKISILALIGISILAIYSFNNIVSNYIGLGLSTVVAFVIAIGVYLLPFSFIIAELATIKVAEKSSSGLTKWIQVCTNRRTSFITSYMFWFANLFYFVGTLPNSINLLSFGFTGQDYTKDATYNLILPFISVIYFAIITFISTLNTKKISRVTSIGGSIIMFLTFFFFAVAIVAWIVGAVNPNLVPGTEAPGLIPNDKLDIWGDSNGLNFVWISTFIWVLMAADGAQTLGPYVKDVKGGAKGFSKGIIWSILLIGLIYVFGTLLVSVFPPKSEGGGTLANGTFIAYFNMFNFMFQNVMTPIQVQQFTYIFIGLLQFFAGFGGILIWTSAPVKTFFSEIPAGVFGTELPRQNRNGVPIWGAWLQFIVVVPLLLAPALGLSDLSEFLGFIKTASGWIGMIPPLIIFLSYFNLRLNRENIERSFKMGNRITGLLISGVMILIFIAILIVTFLEVPFDKKPSEWDPTWWIPVIYKLVCLLVLVLPIHLWYLRYERNLRYFNILKKHNKDTNAVTYFHLTFFGKNKKIISYFFKNECQEYQNKLNELENKFKKIIKSYKLEKKELTKKYKEEIKQKSIELRSKFKNEDLPFILEYISSQKIKLKTLLAEKKSYIFENKAKEKIAIFKKEQKIKMNDEIKKIKDDFKIKISSANKNEISILVEEKNKNIIEIKNKYLVQENNFEIIKKINEFNNQIKEISKPINGEYEIFENEIVKEKEIKSFIAIRKNVITSKNLLDKLTVHKDGIIFHYWVNGEYDKYHFNFKNSKFILRNESLNKVRFSEEEELEMNSLLCSSLNGCDFSFENLYIHNANELIELVDKNNKSIFAKG